MAHTAQHEVGLADGTRVHRLPLGHAAGRWWLTFIVSGPLFDRHVDDDGSDYVRTLHALVSLEGPEGQVAAPTASGGGDGLHHVLVEPSTIDSASYYTARRSAPGGYLRPVARR